MREILALFAQNIKRVENLISLYGPPVRGRRKVKETDILRAALVLLHATLEDFLRSLLILKVPNADQEIVDKYPLAGSDRKRPEKFSLGALAKHRGTSVDELIRQSVVDYLDRWSNFNDLGEVKKALVLCGIDNDLIEGHDFGYLPAMIARRHNIVHKADRNGIRQGQGHHTTKSIGLKEISRYVESVKNLQSFVVDNLPQ